MRGAGSANDALTPLRATEIDDSRPHRARALRRLLPLPPRKHARLRHCQMHGIRMFLAKGSMCSGAVPRWRWTLARTRMRTRVRMLRPFSPLFDRGAMASDLVNIGASSPFSTLIPQRMGHTSKRNWHISHIFGCLLLLWKAMRAT